MENTKKLSSKEAGVPFPFFDQWPKSRTLAHHILTRSPIHLLTHREREKRERREERRGEKRGEKRREEERREERRGEKRGEERREERRREERREERRGEKRRERERFQNHQLLFSHASAKVKIRRKEKSPQPGIELITTRS